MENESDTHNYTHLSLHTRSGRQSVGRAASYARRKRMNEKKKKEAREKKKQNFSNCRTSALGLGLSPSCVARRLLPAHSLAHYACNNNGNRLGQTFFLNSRQVAASGALLLLLLPACHLGFRAKEIARLQFGHTTLPGYVFHLLLLLVRVTSFTSAFACPCCR